MSAPRHSLRKAVLLHARRGDYASAAEIAIAASVSRQTATRWMEEAGIDLRAARIKYISKLYVAEQEYLARLQGMPRLTVEAKHRLMNDAVRRLNAAQDKRAAKKH